MTDQTCLIVDDEPAIRQYLRAVMGETGLHFLEAGAAVEALQIVERLGGRIDLLITDIEMPGEMDGVDLAYSVWNSFPALPVIVLTGRTDRAPAGFITVKKPFRPEAILHAIDQAICRHSTV